MKRRVRLLDIGAGTGYMTKMMSPLFHEVVATEASHPMVLSLRQRGLQTVETCDIEADSWLRGQSFDTISCLNVLDRCDKPITLLHQIRRLLLKWQAQSGRPGLCVLAVVFPFCPFVEAVAGMEREPTEYLRLSDNSTFEGAVNSFVRDVFRPVGLEVVAMSRVPYVSIEDMVYVLDNAIFMLKPSFGSSIVG